MAEFLLAAGCAMADQCLDSTADFAASDGIVTRIRGEYTEMPGLSLTPQQAGRLWNLDPGLCLGVLDELVRAGFLRRSGHQYVRAYEGPFMLRHRGVDTNRRPSLTR